jgi:hypothetical protein
MKQHEIEIGKTYTAKVNAKIVKVRIDDVSPHGGWTATNTATGKKIRIRSPQRLRAPAEAATKKMTTKQAPSENTPAQSLPVESVTPIPKPTKAMSGLDAAAKVLADAGMPLNAKAIVERMLAQGLWKTGGKTPEATLHAAISREIAQKGEGSRFRKFERGHFTVAE